MNKTNKIMTREEAKDFISHCSRAEWYECPRSYNKAIRVTLINLGYDEEWVNETFRDMLDEFESSFVSG